MGGRTDGEEIHHHQLAVVVPARGDETGLGIPAHGKGLAAVEHPGPVDAVVELRGERGDLGVVEVSADCEDPTEEDSGVDGGDFDVDEGFTGFDVAKVIEKAMLVGHLVEMEVECGDDLLPDAIGIEVTPLVGDAECGEAEAGGGDACGEVLVELASGGFVGGAVEYLSGDWVGLFGEVETACALHLFEEGEVVVGEQPCVCELGRSSLLRLEGRCCKTREYGSAEEFGRAASRDFRRSRSAGTHSLYRTFLPGLQTCLTL